MENKNQIARIKVKDLSIGYTHPKTKVLHENISFDILPGDFVALIGSNGIGKSTLLRSLSNLQKPINGKIKVQDKNINHYSASELAHEISLVLTNPPASKNLTALEYISLGRFPHTNWLGHLSKKDKLSINQAIEITQTQDLIHQQCYALSDGQYQRIAIARAIAQDTPIIILDEPTSHLDMHHKVEVLKLLNTLSKEHNKSVIFASHEIEWVIQLCNKIIIMLPNQAKLLETKELLETDLLNQLFSKEYIEFDKNSKRFKII